MTRIAIIGSEGFIGRELRRQCEAIGLAVTGLDSVPSPEPGHVVMDVLDDGAVRTLPEDVGVVVHLAAVSRDADCAKDPGRAVDVNVRGALNMFRAARARGARQFVFASSEWVYGEVDGRGPQTEDMPIDVRNVKSEYALTKLMAEQMLRIAARRDPGTALTILRFGIVYGPRPANWSAVEQLFDAVLRNEPINVRGSLRTARRFIHVTDIALGILAAITLPQDVTLNLSGDVLVSLGDVIRESAALLGRTPVVSEGDPNAASVRDPDNSKARTVLGWSPRIGLTEGLRSLHAPVPAP